MRIFLSGAKGNLGRELVNQADCKVIQCNRDDWGELEGKFSAGIDVVIHAASDLHTEMADSPVRLMDSNLMATLRLLEAAGRYRVPRFIFISSCAVYGEDMRTGEEERCCPISVNGISKLLNEKIIAEYCSAHGVKFAILRVFNTYGGTDHFSILSQLQRALAEGVPFTLNNRGVAQRDFIHVSDVAKVVLRLSEMNLPYTHINVGTGVATKISSLIKLVTERFPGLSIVHAKAVEAEYSRADISRLLSLVDIDFVRIEDYVQNDFPDPR